MLINSTIKSISYDGDDIRTFSFSANVTHPDYPGVSVDFGGEPLVSLPRGTDLQEYVQMQFTHDQAFVVHMTNALEFEFIKAGLTVESAVLTPEGLRQHAAQQRWKKEVGGIKLNGLVIHADDRSKIMISGARVAAEANPNFTTQWKGADGSFVTLNAVMIVAISNAVSNHVSNCFALEAQVISQIEAGTITTTTEIDAAFG